MTLRRVVAAVVVCLAAMTVGWLARPARFEVDGLSMAPGLMPGNVVTSGAFPIADWFRQPRRFERWIIDAPGDGTAIKRLAGLPGETISIADGELVVDGNVVLKSPSSLAEMAIEVPIAATPVDSRHVHIAAAEVLDDVPFATEVNRPLLPVHDVGIAAIVCSTATAVRISITVHNTRISWELAAHRQACFVAGRLDGHLVAAGWGLHGNPALRDHRCLPVPTPDSWSHAEPWPTGDVAETDAPALTFDVAGDGAVVERLTLWRDVLYRPAAGGRDEWRLGRDEFVVLGDFPTGSRDSRHWGPLTRGALRQRVSE
ncbi:MAG: S26 family signal peptidase [Pirellulales bacterium]